MATIDRLDIFQAGHYPQGDISVADLDSMIANFQILAARGATFLPPVKIGHGPQEILKRSGFPAAGYLTKLWREGEKLFAAVADVPQVVADLINRRAFKSRSIEMEKAAPPIGPRLTALALLGEDMPAVQTLQEFLALYSAREPAGVVSFGVKFQGENSMPADVAALTKQVADLTAANKTLTDENAKLTESVKTFGEKISALEKLVAPPAGSPPKTDGDTGAVAKMSAQAQRDLLVIQAGAREVLRQNFTARAAKLVSEGRLPPAVLEAGLVDFVCALDHEGVVKFSANPEPLTERLFRLLAALPAKFQVGKECASGSIDDAAGGKSKTAEEIAAENKTKWTAEFAAKKDRLGDVTLAEYLTAREQRAAAEKKN